MSGFHARALEGRTPRSSCDAEASSPDRAVDRVGAAASSLCATHCALSSLLPAAFGMLGLGFLLSEEVEWGLTAVALTLGSWALVSSWRKTRSLRIAALLAMGINPVWLGIMIAVNLQTSFLTPPFGFSLFYLRGVTPDEVPTSALYRGAIPFIAIQLLMLGMLAAVMMKRVVIVIAADGGGSAGGGG